MGKMAPHAQTRESGRSLLEALGVGEQVLLPLRAAFDQVFTEATEQGYPPEAAGTIAHHTILTTLADMPGMRMKIMLTSQGHTMEGFVGTMSMIATAICIEAIGDAPG